MSLRCWSWFAAGMLVSLLAGCSSQSPIAAPEPGAPDPPASPALPVTQRSPDFVPVAVSEDFVTGFGTFGTIGGTIDPETLAITLDAPKRTGTLGEIFDVDITDFTNEEPCVNCMRIEGFGVNAEDHLELEVSLRHPFRDPAFFFTRPDLNVFDARVTLIIGGFETSDALRVWPDNATADAALTGNLGVVVNADGHTSHFDSRAEDPRYFDPPKGIQGNVNPFKRYFVNDSQALPFLATDPTGWNVFPIASPQQSQIFEIDRDRLLTQEGAVPFVLVAEASWGVGRNLQLPQDDLGGRRNPAYWLPAFNQHEPWSVDVQVLGNALRAGIDAGVLTIEVRVADWQAGRTGDPTYPDLANLGAIPVTSDVERVRAAAPGVDAVGASTSERLGGTGTFSDPYRYQLQLRNGEGAEEGTWYGIVAAEDTLHGSDSGPQRVPELGFPRLGAEIRNYAGYKVFPFTIQAVNFEPIVNPATMTPANGVVDAGEEICFSANILDPNPGDTHTVDWDFSFVEADGFLPEAQGLNVCHTYTEPGQYTVAALATDDGDPVLSGFNDAAATVKVNGTTFPVYPFGDERLDRTPTDGGQHAIGYTNLGGLVIAFAGAETPGGDEDIFISLSTTFGQSFFAPVNVTDAAGDQTNPAVAVLNGTVMIAWEDVGGVSGIQSQNGGQAYGAPFLIHPNGRRPAVAVSQPNLFYVAYENGGDVFLEVNTVSGVTDFTGGPLLLNSETDGLQTRPALAVWQSSDLVHAVWEDEREPLFGIDLWGARIEARGTDLESDRVLSTDRGAGDDTEPSLVIGDNGDYLALAFITEQFRGTGDVMLLRTHNQGVTWLPGAVVTTGQFGLFASPALSVTRDVGTLMLGYTKTITDPVFATAPVYRLSTDQGIAFEAEQDPEGRSFRDPNTSVAVPPVGIPVTTFMWTDQQAGSDEDLGQLVMQFGFKFPE